MLRNAQPVGLWAAYQNYDRSTVVPKKPQFSMAKTKARLAQFFAQNEDVRQLSDETKAQYPRMHQSVQHTAWTLLMYYIKHWGKSTARNYEIRITHSYIRQALNDSCCIATVKNHINKLLRMYRGFIREKSRGGLGLPNQNTACIVLELDPTVLQFEDDRHNEAVKQGIESAEQSRRIEAEHRAKDRAASQSILATMADIQDQAERRSETPSSIADIFQAAFGSASKRE